MLTYQYRPSAFKCVIFATQLGCMGASNGNSLRILAARVRGNLMELAVEPGLGIYKYSTNWATEIRACGLSLFESLFASNLERRGVPCKNRPHWGRILKCSSRLQRHPSVLSDKLQKT